ncbi:MAG: hypothetical protein OXH57_03195, partial [Ekhidna sp.]|nr:hypothetical protein [Ekhidna sp.]
MKRYLSAIIILICTIYVHAQNWEKRHKFAKTYFGVSNYIVPRLSIGRFLDTNEDIQSFNRNGFLSPAINMGATHFWGYADFYVSINTSDIKFRDDELSNSFRLGTFTGCRVYPFVST